MRLMLPFAVVVVVFVVLAACNRDPCAVDCQWFGLCTQRAGQCVATNAADCRKSDACRDYGRCTVDRDECRIGSDADCRSAAPCRLDGRCGKPAPIAGISASKEKCIATAQADCAASQACRERNLCKLGRNGCEN